jgi:hypothetical protein
MRTRSVTLPAVALVVAACGSISSSSDGSTPDTSGPVADASPPRCDPLAPFSAPTPVPGLESVINADEPRLTPDELAIYFGAVLRGDATSDVYRATRERASDPFGPPSKIASASTTGQDYGPWVSSDQLTLLFHSNQSGAYHIYAVTRSSPSGQFGEPVELNEIEADGGQEGSPFVASDGGLWFVSDHEGGVGGGDIWRAPAAPSGFGTPVAINELNSSATDEVATLSDDDLTVYFASDRTGGAGGADVWRSHRTDESSPFPAPSPVTELNEAMNEIPSWISPDNCRLYLQSDRGGNSGLYVATRSP